MTRTPSVPALPTRSTATRGRSTSWRSHGGHTGHHSPAGSGGPDHAAGSDRDPNGWDLGCVDVA